PEHIQVSNTSGTWKGSVIHVEHLGADTIIYLQTDFGPLTVRLFGEHQYEVDQVLYATPDAGRTYRFDANDQIIKA
ncbi:MAG: TOBE domain-containing protein, partial [Phyllobacterium sp.]|nr:TOBE domain-containing protein [Phyllobacterium sp.]